MRLKPILELSLANVDVNDYTVTPSLPHCLGLLRGKLLSPIDRSARRPADTGSRNKTCNVPMQLRTLK